MLPSFLTRSFNPLWTGLKLLAYFLILKSLFFNLAFELYCTFLILDVMVPIKSRNSGSKRFNFCMDSFKLLCQIIVMRIGILHRYLPLNNQIEFICNIASFKQHFIRLAELVLEIRG